LRATRITVLWAAFFFAWWRECSLSVLTGQVAVMVNPARMSEVKSASHASCFLCVNITVRTPSSRKMRRHSLKVSVIRPW
jgi:hypothetical protein